MRVEAIAEALQAKPFVSFRIVLPSDRSVPVPHWEFVSIAPNRRWVLVWNRRGGWSLIEPGLVVQLRSKKQSLGEDYFVKLTVLAEQIRFKDD